VLDRSRETLCSSDVAVAQVRRILLDALEAVGSGGLPPGSVRAPGGVRMPNAIEALVSDDEHWADLVLDQVTS
jgi:hypothetical protein